MKERYDSVTEMARDLSAHPIELDTRCELRDGAILCLHVKPIGDARQAGWHVRTEHFRHRVTGPEAELGEHGVPAAVLLFQRRYERSRPGGLSSIEFVPEDEPGCEELLWLLDAEQVREAVPYLNEQIAQQMLERIQ